MNYTSREGNNFNLIRMIAAYLVIISHATAIQGTGTDIVVRITGQTHSGQMAVFIFTFLSGIFITKSVISSDTWNFFKKRVLRIYPELIICLIVTLIIGGIFTTYSQLDYWTSSQVKKYFFANLLEISNEHFLPGVFENHPNAGLNGVLWYITFEIRIYLIWTLMKSLRVFEDKTKANIVLLVLLSWAIGSSETMPFIGRESALYGSVDFPQYTITFILGALLYINVSELYICWGHLMVAFMLMIVFRHSSIATWVWAAGYILAAMWIGTNHKLFKYKIKDLSYGIFLYGWVTGQIVYEIVPNASAPVAALLTAIIATAMSYLSAQIIDLSEKFRTKLI